MDVAFDATTEELRASESVELRRQANRREKGKTHA